MTALTADERAVLAVFAGASEPLDWGDVVELLLPPRPRAPRRGGKQAWMARFEEMMRATAALYEAGLLAGRAEGLAYMTAITEAGREAVESIPSGLIVTDVALSPEEVEALRRKWEAEASTLPTSAFWVDLDRHLQDPKFRRSYIKESSRIRESGDRMNADDE